jgi:hypothetical protein
MRTPTPRWHLAELNVMRMLAPVDHATMVDFVALLAPINALAEASPGFVWRLEAENIDPFDDTLLVNYSIWRSQQELWNFLYASQHLDVIRRRREWAERLPTASHVLWWIPAGTVPAISDAVARLEQLRTLGPSPHAFTFRSPFPPPDAPQRRSNGHRPARHRDDEVPRGPSAGLGSSPSLPTQLTF